MSDAILFRTWDKCQCYDQCYLLFILKSIDLSSNDLTGEIPKEVRYLLELVSLNLSRNRLSGEILPEIGNLTSLELSRNHFSCEVPSTLSKIDRLPQGILPTR